MCEKKTPPVIRIIQLTLTRQNKLNELVKYFK
jgi:hypothetical protein